MYCNYINTEGGIFEAGVGFYNFWRIFGSILIYFYCFQAILMVLEVWEMFLSQNGIEIISKYGLEIDF